MIWKYFEIPFSKNPQRPNDYTRFFGNFQQLQGKFVYKIATYTTAKFSLPRVSPFNLSPIISNSQGLEMYLDLKKANGEIAIKNTPLLSFEISNFSDRDPVIGTDRGYFPLINSVIDWNSSFIGTYSQLTLNANVPFLILFEE